MNYTKASASFHQWTSAADKKTYGLNFASETDATNFDKIMSEVIAQVDGTQAGLHDF